MKPLLLLTILLTINLRSCGQDESKHQPELGAISLSEPTPDPSPTPTPLPSNCFYDAEGNLVCYPIDPNKSPTP